jgi:hypothetical protein
MVTIGGCGSILRALGVSQILVYQVVCHSVAELAAHAVAPQAVLDDPQRYADFALEHGTVGYETMLHKLYVHAGHARREVGHTNIGTFLWPGRLLPDCLVGNETSAYSNQLRMTTSKPPLCSLSKKIILAASIDTVFGGWRTRDGLRCSGPLWQA